MAQAAVESITSRRSFLAGLAVCTPLAAAAVPPPTSNDDATLIDLGHQLVAAWSEERRISTLWHNIVTDEADEATAQTVQRCTDIVEQIERCHPTTLKGFQVKATAVLWCHSGDLDLGFLNLGKTTDLRLTESIVYDLIFVGA